MKYTVCQNCMRILHVGAFIPNNHYTCPICRKRKRAPHTTAIPNRSHRKLRQFMISRRGSFVKTFIVLVLSIVITAIIMPIVTRYTDLQRGYKAFGGEDLLPIFIIGGIMLIAKIINDYKRRKNQWKM